MKKKIPVILLLTRGESELPFLLDAFNHSGTSLAVIITSSALQTNLGSNIHVEVCPSEKMRQTLAKVLRERSDEWGDCEQLVIFEDDHRIIADDVIQGVYLSSLEPEAVYIFQLVARLKMNHAPQLRLMEKLVGVKLDEPSPFFWVAPQKALNILRGTGVNQRYFPLSWLHACHKENIPIRNLYFDSFTDEIPTVQTFGTLRALLFSLDVFFRFAFSSLICMLVDNLAFFALTRLSISSTISLAVSRFLSVMVNYILLRFAVFKEKNETADSFFRYILLTLFSTSIVWLALRHGIPSVSSDPMIIKIIVEAIMFIFNYFMAKTFVFRGK